ncbi:hypothetical protein F2Q68_00042041 [Brassica cretica]|uniref:Uncharacterized protein n=1 Tax=Brassica cretica TaxID=69181 RepID=A0A8S9MUQ6_BRACR|nr:hypothetical protein F2Q68_00042041 [Brassica cretica]
MESQRKESLPSHRIAPSVERHSARNDPRQLSGFMRDARRANLPYNQKDLRSHLDNIYYAGDTRSRRIPPKIARSRDRTPSHSANRDRKSTGNRASPKQSVRPSKDDDSQARNTLHSSPPHFNIQIP